MSGPKFTPAPWEQNGINAVHAKNGTCVAITHNGENRKADATLIAAAPAMYAAMQDFCSRVERGEVRSRKTYEQFQSILAAARGEANQSNPQP